MKYNKLISIIIFFILFSSLIPLYSNNSDKNNKPEPYGKNEFPIWQKDLRRFEIITFGAMPFVSLLSFWSYDIIRYNKHKGDPSYKPWPLKNPEIAKPLTESEQKKIFGSIVGISIGIAIIDLSYRLIKRAINKKKIKKVKITDDAIQLIPFDEVEFDITKGSIKEKNLFIPIQDGKKNKPNN